MRDLDDMARKLAYANDGAIFLIAKHDPASIRETVLHLRDENRELYEKLDRFETIQSAIIEFLKV